MAFGVFSRLFVYLAFLCVDSFFSLMFDIAHSSSGLDRRISFLMTDDLN